MSVLQLAQPRVAQPKPGTIRPQVCLCWTALASAKANSKLMPSASTPGAQPNIISYSDLTDKMKRSFFQAAVVSILLYGWTTWTLTKRLENKLDGNYTRMLRAILNKSWRQHPIRQQLYGHLPPITKTIQVRRTKHAGHCWRSKNELISDVLLWTPAYGQAKARWPARTYIQQLCEDTGCNPEDLLEAMNDREKWREMVRHIRAGGMTWGWWWLSIYIVTPNDWQGVWDIPFKQFAWVIWDFITWQKFLVWYQIIIYSWDTKKTKTATF